MNKKPEYVSKKELKPHKNWFNDNLIKNLKEHFINNFVLQHRLVGSSKRNLVIKHHNKGYDLDYQLIIHKNKNNLTAKEIKDKIFKYIQDKHSKECDIKFENSTSAITIKKIDEKNNKINCSYDIVIVNEKIDVLEIIVRDNNGNYIFQKQPEYNDFKKNMKYIKKINCDKSYAINI